MTGCVLLLLLLLPHQSAFALTEAELRQAILEGTTDVATMDCNEDGKVDVADLVCYLGANVPAASFEDTAVTVKEGVGQILLHVTFTQQFSGTLTYTMSGTATSGEDFQPLTGWITVNGESVDIPVTILDDLELEDVETIVLTIDPGTSEDFIMGVPHQHTILIDENDNVWSGGLEVENLWMGFEMTILQNGTNYQAEVVSDGSGGLPAGTYPVTGLNITETEFSATIGSIIIPAETTLFNTEFNRTVTLSANITMNPDDHVLDIESEISGDASDSFQATETGKEYLSHTIDGTFTLIKADAALPLLETELVVLP